MSKNKKFNLNGLLEKPVIKNFITPVIRGAIQTIPGGGIVVQGMRNISHEFDATKEGKPPHNYISIMIQIVGIGVIIYAFASKMITVEQVLQLIGFIE